MDSTAFLIIAIIAISLQGLTLFLALFEPTLRYKITSPPQYPLNSKEFLSLLGAIADARIHYNTSVEVLTNGEAFYPAILETIRAATKSVTIEAYIYQRGKIGREIADALAERARNGVQVHIVLDAVGSFLTFRGYFRELLAAGGRVEFYHPFRPHLLPRINYRTHRELIIIDGEVGFIGGPGIADHWYTTASRKSPRWRDTMFRVRGEAVTAMQAAFLENWLEATGELLIGPEYFAFPKVEGKCGVMIIDSSPSAGQSTHARTLFQTLLASAKQQIEITTPYFLPDKGVRDELKRAIKERGVEVKIITPGKHNDHWVTRRSSRRLYGGLLKAGAKIYEYKPAMIHVKTLVVDGLWCVVGSTNFDHRSFSINDECNLASCNPELAARLREDFARDLAQSRPVTYRDWLRRPIWEKMQESFGWILERQQ
ncbi:MAG TPA: phospholipase D-like domain-containing protein [Bryobacteraceae bacterium]|nr:phospholipase D-like domain-containing protein [Bryobacteraceae bacterium]